MLQEYGTLENVLANADKVKGDKLRQNLKNFVAQAYMSRDLVRLNQHLPIEFDWDANRRRQPDVPGIARNVS